MTVASSTSERVIDDSVDGDSARSRESGIVGVAGGNHAGTALVGDDRGAHRLLGAEALDTAAVRAVSVGPSFSSDVSVNRESVDRNSVHRGSVDQQPVHRDVEREASPVASAVQSGTERDEDIDIATDDGLGPAGPDGAAVASSGDDGTIEVADDEIETADPALSIRAQPFQQTLPSSSIAPPTSYAPYGVTRSRPPAPPSSRPRMPMPSLSGVTLPRPVPSNGAPGSNRPSGIDPWALANKTLELAHANARIGELEEMVAYRDARILELQESLARARRKVEDLEQRSRPVTLPAASGSPVAGELARTSSETPPTPRTPVVLAVSAAGSAPVGDASGAALRGGAPSVDLDDDHEADDDGDEYGDDRDSGIGLGDGAAILRSSSEDDLQQISGIGPRFEAALRKHGITRLSQIAAWSDADVRQVAKALKIPKSRIVKGRWVEVAREVIGTRAASE